MKTKPIEGSQEWLVNMIAAAGFLFFCTVVLFAVVAYAVGPKISNVEVLEENQDYTLRTFERMQEGRKIICTVIGTRTVTQSPSVSCVVL